MLRSSLLRAATRSEALVASCQAASAALRVTEACAEAKPSISLREQEAAACRRHPLAPQARPSQQQQDATRRSSPRFGGAHRTLHTSAAAASGSSAQAEARSSAEAAGAAPAAEAPARHWIKKEVDGRRGRQDDAGSPRPPASEERQRVLNSRIVGARDIGAILAIVRDRGRAFNSINVSTAWHRLAVQGRKRQWGAAESRRGVTGSPEIKRLTELTEEKFDECTLQQLGVIAWAWAALGFTPPRELRRKTYTRVLGGAASGQERDLQGQSVSNVLWAAATSAYPLEGRALARAIELATELSGEFTPQGLSNTLWAFATLDKYPGEELLGRAAARVVAEAAAFKPMELSNTAWAWAALRHHPGEAALRAIEAQLERRPGAFSPQAVSVILWSMTILNHRPADSCIESIERWVSPEVGGGGEGASGQGDEDAAEAAPSDDDDADSIAASRKAPRGGAPGGRDAAAESRASVLAGQTLKPQDCANMLWALSVFGFQGRPLFAAVWGHAISIPTKAFTREGLNTLFQVEMLFRAEGRPKGLPHMPRRLYSACEQCWVGTVAGIKPSDSHRAFSRALKALGVPHKNEKRTSPDNLLSMDIALGGRAREKVALEVDGPMHFLRNTGAPTGRTLLRDRLLAARGVEVVSLPWTEWPPDLTDAGAHAEYLRRKLSEGVLEKYRLIPPPPAANDATS